MNTQTKIYPSDLTKMKVQGQKISMITAYDCPTAQVVEQAGIDVVLVGDSLGNTVLGYENTLPVTMEEQLHHVKAVRRGISRALLVADMPYLSFQVSETEAVKNAGRFIKEGHAEAVKLEGGTDMAPLIKCLIHARIAVMGHIGLTPQSIHLFGGYKVQGKSKEAAEQLVNDALAIEQAGVFAIVLEGLPWPLSQEISQKLTIPTIGIGAGPYCDGQVLVFHDLVGFTFGPTPRFVRQYCNLKETLTHAVRNYISDVQQERFPTLEESYGKKNHSNSKDNSSTEGVK
jgi:3-methyl-2-oxobutanoate hydroxymethyltransferase